MIGWLKGTVKHIEGPRLLIDTGGIGYEVLVPERVKEAFTTGDGIELFIHTHVREDEISLYGFSTLFDRSLFEILTSVSGIGPKTALGILSATPPDKLISAIQLNNPVQLQQIPGIGKKTAERLIVELKDKLKNVVIRTDGKAPRPTAFSTLSEEVLSALINLGYKSSQAEAALAQVELSETSSFDKMLKESLKFMTK